MKRERRKIGFWLDLRLFLMGADQTANEKMRQKATRPCVAILLCIALAGLSLAGCHLHMPEQWLLYAALGVAAAVVLALAALFLLLPFVSFCMSIREGIREKKLEGLRRKGKPGLLSRKSVKLDLWLMNKRSATLFRILEWALLALAAIGVFWAAMTMPPVGKWIRRCAGIIAWGVALVYGCVLWQDTRKRELLDYLEENKESALLVATVLGTALVGLTFWAPELWGVSLPQISAGDGLFGYYTAQLSLTFISISVMSVLSDRSVIIYWQNVAQSKLIRPVFRSFASYTAYSIGTTVGAGISVILQKPLAFYIFFGINVLVLIGLTLTMVDVYYSREKKRKRLVQELQSDFSMYNATRKDTDEMRKMENISQALHSTYKAAKRYQDNMLMLQQNIYRAEDEHDLVFMREVYDLYVRQSECFDSPEGEQVVSLLMANVGPEQWPVMMTNLRENVRKVEDSLKDTKTDPFGGGKHWEKGLPWNQDESLWTALSQSWYLRNWLKAVGNNAVYRKDLWFFMELILRRIVALYNHAVIGYNLQHAKKAEQLQVLHKDGALWVKKLDGGKPDAEQIADVFNAYFGTLAVESHFLPRLLEVVLAMLENLGEYYRDCLVAYYSAFSFFNECTPFAATLEFDQREEEIWAKAFPSREDPDNN